MSDPIISVANVTIAEGDANNSVIQFRLELNQAGTLPVTVDVVTRSGTATQGIDFLGGGATVTFDPGVTAYIVNVNVMGDRRYELAETFQLVLSNATNGTLSNGAATMAALATITNDDPLPTQQGMVLTVNNTPVVIKFDTNLAPAHVARVIELAQAGVYDGSPFHRVLDGFVAQTGLTTVPAHLELLPAEFNAGAFVRGAVGMARATDPNSATTQFFVMLEEAAYLNGNYTRWGQVLNGMEAIDALPRGEPPASPGVITSAKVATLVREGGAGADALTGSAGADVLLGGGGRDTLTGGAGDDTLIGGAGTDTAVFSGARALYTITSDAQGQTITGPDGTDRLISVELLQFADTTIGTLTATGASNIIHRFYNTATNTHFFTASNSEADSVRKNLPGFEDEGIAFRSAPEGAAGSVDVYRFYNTELGFHFYTANAAERDAVIANLPMYQYEGAAYRAYTADAGPQEEVYRFFNNKTGAHLMTTSEAERDAILIGLPDYRYEGIAFYVDV